MKIYGDESESPRMKIHGGDITESPRMKIHGGDITEMPIDENLWW